LLIALRLPELSKVRTAKNSERSGLIDGDALLGHELFYPVGEVLVGSLIGCDGIHAALVEVFDRQFHSQPSVRQVCRSVW